MPDPILVGRNEPKLKALCGEHSVEEYSTDLDSLLGDRDYPAYALFVLASGVSLQFNSPWCVRIRRDDLWALQVDGSGCSRGGSVAGWTSPIWPDRRRAGFGFLPGAGASL